MPKLPILSKLLKYKFYIATFVLGSLIIGLLAFQSIKISNEKKQTDVKQADLVSKIHEMQKQLETLQKEDQYVKNKTLEATISAIQKTYTQAVSVYEDLIELKKKNSKTEKMDVSFAYFLSLLSQRNYTSASATLTFIHDEIKKSNESIAILSTVPTNVATNNTPPSSGYSRQAVESDVGKFIVNIISADLNSTRVIVDTASDQNCSNDCPVSSLADYTGRNGAFAGINGPYFCPAEYPSCSDKKNSYDTLLMNKNKVYFNSDNNVYSNVPAVIFSGSSARWVSKSLEWGWDTGVDSVIANQPLLTLGGQIMFGGDGDPKKGSRGSRSFIGTTGSKVYIGVVSNATVAESAHVMKTLGIENALNLDSGGSTALWSGGKYIVGPGRNTPFGILLVGK